MSKMGRTTFFFDHMESRPISNVARISVRQLRESAPDDVTEVGSWKEALYVIGHFSETQLNNDIYISPESTNPDYQVVLCLTRERPGFPIERPRHRRVMAGSKIRYVLFARDVNALNRPEVVRAFYNIDGLQAETVVNNESERMSSELRNLFVLRSLEYLPSLLILCQGFLAAHATQDASGRWGPGEIENALAQMGWPSFMEKLEKAKDPGLESLKGKLAEQRPETAKRSWWLSIYEEDASKIRKQIAEEWGVPDIAECPDLKSLVDAIYGPDPNIAGRIVAEAYCAIVKRLGGDQCERI